MFWPFLGYKLICLHFKVEFSVFILLYLYPFLQKIVVVLSFLKEIYVYSFITKKIYNLPSYVFFKRVAKSETRTKSHLRNVPSIYKLNN